MSSQPFAKKSLGQHFLHDRTVVDRIMQAAGPLAGKTVYEAGPGPGVLTEAILNRGCAKLISIDKDERARQWLEPLQRKHSDQFELIIGDALTAPLPQIQEPFLIISNLPYNVGTALLIRWLHSAPAVGRMVLMFQKEVAQRISAAPDTPAYGRLAVLAQTLGIPEPCFDVPPGAFTPPPKVWSSVIALTPKPPVDPKILKRLEEISACVFNNRRKMLRVTLGKGFPELAEALPDLGVSPSDRPQSVSPVKFWEMAAASVRSQERS